MGDFHYVAVIEGGNKTMRFFSGPGVQTRAMDAVLKFLVADTTIFGFDIHNWMLIIGGIVAIWALSLVPCKPSAQVNAA